MYEDIIIIIIMEDSTVRFIFFPYDKEQKTADVRQLSDGFDWPLGVYAMTLYTPDYFVTYSIIHFRLG